MPGGTDGTFLREVGIRSYGFLPLRLPSGFDFFSLMHAVDERVPVAAVDFGAAVVRDYLWAQSVR